ncbi:MAG: hypothetical protein IT164_03005 [Bryobacterales bacterium]|nr:hypothetical protein [Bryobacterales bacterium]
MTRRQWLAAAASASPARAGAAPPVLPVHQVLDRKAKHEGPHERAYWEHIWPQAANDVARCGVRLAMTYAVGEVERPPSRTPVIHGLSRGKLNLVVTSWIPFVAVNTCTHELLHALLLDIFENRPPGLWGQAREFRVDALATRLWLLKDGSPVKGPARGYLKRLEAGG